MRLAIAFIVAALLVYFGFAFAHWALDPTSWSFDARAICASTMIISGAIATGIQASAY